MSHLNIDMKKNSMRKNRKLVINIASTKKDLLSSRFEANHQDLGSSIKDDKKRFVLNMMKRLIMVPMIVLGLETE
uniref:Uncharacterized protein n=1 Tax=Brassica oleracea TaxID=3712 RepID=A0A3P6FVQ2_BRAOL|nr:unnamed protein product [Brassica oleracea]